MRKDRKSIVLNIVFARHHRRTSSCLRLQLLQLRTPCRLAPTTSVLFAVSHVQPPLSTRRSSPRSVARCVDVADTVPPHRPPRIALLFNTACVPLPLPALRLSPASKPTSDDAAASLDILTPLPTNSGCVCYSALVSRWCTGDCALDTNPPNSPYAQHSVTRCTSAPHASFMS